MKNFLRLLFVIAILIAGSSWAVAQGPFFPLIVNGTPNLGMDYSNGVLMLHFNRTPRGAGQPNNYVGNVRPGQGAWVDRPIAPNEPVVIKQQMTEQQANQAIARLRQNGGYWRFFCRNTNKGYYEVSHSEPAYASVRID